MAIGTPQSKSTKSLLARDPKDSAAYNRLGRAYLERRDYTTAYEAYSDALKSDPANLISRRNLQRLEHLRSAKEPGQDAPATSFPRTLVFIEEVGKTWVDELVNPEPMAELAEIYAGQKLELVPEGNRLAVHDASGRRIGEIEAKTAERVIQLMAAGNLYEVYALGPSSASIRIILREVHHDPALAGQISFPRQIAATRKYLRERDDLRRRDDPTSISKTTTVTKRTWPVRDRIRRTIPWRAKASTHLAMSIRTKTTRTRSSLPVRAKTKNGARH